MSELTSLPNIGKVSAEQLKKVGINTAEELRNVGSKEALKRIREQVDPGACIMMLYGLEGAIQNIEAKFLPDEVKKDLREFHKSL